MDSYTPPAITQLMHQLLEMVQTAEASVAASGSINSQDQYECHVKSLRAMVPILISQGPGGGSSIEILRLLNYTARYFPDVFDYSNTGSVNDVLTSVGLARRVFVFGIEWAENRDLAITVIKQLAVNRSARMAATLLYIFTQCLQALEYHFSNVDPPKPPSTIASSFVTSMLQGMNQSRTMTYPLSFLFLAKILSNLLDGGAVADVCPLLACLARFASWDFTNVPNLAIAIYGVMQQCCHRLVMVDAVSSTTLMMVLLGAFAHAKELSRSTETIATISKALAALYPKLQGRGIFWSRIATPLIDMIQEKFPLSMLKSLWSILHVALLEDPSLFRESGSVLVACAIKTLTAFAEQTEDLRLLMASCLVICGDVDRDAQVTRKRKGVDGLPNQARTVTSMLAETITACSTELDTISTWSLDRWNELELCCYIMLFPANTIVHRSDVAMAMENVLRLLIAMFIEGKPIADWIMHAVFRCLITTLLSQLTSPSTSSLSASFEASAIIFASLPWLDDAITRSDSYYAFRNLLQYEIPPSIFNKHQNIKSTALRKYSLYVLSIIHTVPQWRVPLMLTAIQRVSKDVDKALYQHAMMLLPLFNLSLPLPQYKTDVLRFLQGVEPDASLGHVIGLLYCPTSLVVQWLPMTSTNVSLAWIPCLPMADAPGAWTPIKQAKVDGQGLVPIIRISCTNNDQLHGKTWVREDLPDLQYFNKVTALLDLARDVNDRVALATSLPHLILHSNIAYQSTTWADNPWISAILVSLEDSHAIVRQHSATALYHLFFQDAEDGVIKMESSQRGGGRDYLLNGLAASLSRSQQRVPVFLNLVQLLGQISMKTHEEDPLLWFCMSHVIVAITHYNAQVQAVAFDVAKKVTSARKLSFSSLCCLFPQPAAAFLVENCIVQEAEYIDKPPPFLLTKLTALEDKTIEQFLISTISLTLPYLVVKRHCEALRWLAMQIGVDMRDLLIGGALDKLQPLKHILTYLFVDVEDNDTLSQAIVFIVLEAKLVTDVSTPEAANLTVQKYLGEMIRACQMDLVLQLSLALVDGDDQRRQKRAAQALKAVAKTLQEDEAIISKRPNPSLNDDQLMSLLLKEKLLFILKHEWPVQLDAKLPKSRRLKSMQCLKTVLGLIGPSLASLTPQVIQVLQAALESPTLRTIAYDVWEVFLRQLEDKHLGPLLGQIVVLLLRVPQPLGITSSLPISSSRSQPSTASSYPASLSRILHYLLVEKVALQKHFKEVFVDLPDDDVRLESARITIRSIGPRDVLATLLSYGLPHENPHVCLAALKRLLLLLRTQYEDLGASMKSATQLALLTNTLLQTAAKYNGTDQAITLIAAECFGELGAVDPSSLATRFQVDTVKIESVQQELVIPLEDKDDDITTIGKSRTVLIRFAEFSTRRECVAFAIHLIRTDLLRLLRALNDPECQDRAALAIQELLLFCCGFNPRAKLDVNTNDGRPLKPRSSYGRVEDMLDTSDGVWALFDQKMRENLVHLLRTNYNFPALVHREPSATCLYLTRSSFREWVVDWTIELMSIEVAKHHGTVQSDVSSIFTTLRGVVRSDLQTALHVLPHLARLIITNGKDSEQRALIQEMIAVLSDVSSGVSQQQQQPSPIKPIDQSAKSLDASLQQPKSVDMQQSAAQTIFAIFDYLKRWIYEVKRLKKDKPSIALADKVESVLKKIPERLIASAAYRCRMYERSLRYFELHIRSRPAIILSASSSSSSSSSSGSINLEELANIPLAAYVDDDGGDVDAVVLEPGIAAKESTLYSQLQTIYAHLEEPDGMAGIALLFSPYYPIGQQISEHRSRGRWSDAQTCYELALQQQQPQQQSPSLRKGLLECLQHLGHLETELAHVKGLLTLKDAALEKDLNDYGVQAAWRLGQWSQLRSFLSSCSDRYDVGLGRLMLALHDRNQPAFQSMSLVMKTALARTLAARAMRSSYRQCYQTILQLHTLADLDCFARETRWFENAIDRRDIMQVLQTRLEFTQKSYRSRETLLDVHRTLLELLSESSNSLGAIKDDLTKQMGQKWLLTSKLARKEKHMQTAYGAVLHAIAFQAAPAAQAERAKQLWAEKQYSEAMRELKSALDIAKMNISHQQHGNNAVITMMKKLELRWARWQEENSASDTLSIKEKYEVALCDPSINNKISEDSHFYFGRFLDNRLRLPWEAGSTKTDAPLRPLDAETRASVLLLFTHYAAALKSSNRHIFQALPRLLTIWLDYGHYVFLAEPDKARPSKNKEKDQIKTQFSVDLSNLTKEIDQLSQHLNPYQWLTSLSQLTSRINHAHSLVYQQLRNILAKLVNHYPHQSLWQMMFLLGIGTTPGSDEVKRRIDRAKEVLETAKQTARDRIALAKHIDVMHRLTTQLTQLTSQSASSARSGSNNNEQCLHEIQNLLSSGKFPKVLLPVQSQLMVTLPASSDMHTHAAFEESVMIVGVDENWVRYHSLRAPLELTFHASNGLQYKLLIKYKDDLRLDSRLLEFDAVVNKLLSSDAEARRRNLHIRTYAVVPLNEMCGLIEFVPNLVTIKKVLEQLYAEVGQNVPRLIREYQSAVDSDSNNRTEVTEQKERKRKEAYLKCRNKLSPAVLHRWLLQRFIEPSGWFSARLGFQRTTAVMSMVGYVVGLGDRHCENMLLDETNGDCVHVDFSVLFDKGLSLPTPERVPFRLTQNIVDAFGITGCEGVFRKCAELALQILRNNKDTLKSVMETFIHDPLLEWNNTKNKNSFGEGSANERAREEGRQYLAKMARKLQGHTEDGPPLSVQGQVHDLIEQARSDDNLASMFFGWTAFL